MNLCFCLSCLVLKVNGKRLLGLNHVSVVEILKHSPQHVRLVCARRKSPPQADPFPAPPSSVPAAPFIPSASFQDGVGSTIPGTERLIKAKSEQALSTSDSAPATSSLNKAKSRSLEPLTGLAMWSSEPVVIELEKGDRGLGFSILDYQVCISALLSSASIRDKEFLLKRKLAC